MVQERRQIQIDPYFDGDGASGPVATVTALQPGQQGYNAADSTMLNHMRMGPAGLRGTVIPHATLGGIPMGTHPHSTQDVMVTIDPHIRGQSSTIRLGDLNASNVTSAMREAAQFTPEPTDIRTFRLRGAAVMHTLANHIAEEHEEESQPMQSRQVRPIQPVAYNPQQPVQVAPQQAWPQNQFPQAYPPQQSSRQQSQPQPQLSQRRAVSPLAAFNQPIPQPQRELRQIDIRPQLSDFGQPIVPPTINVIFEMKHFGVMEACYHDVIIEQGFIVLVFDTRSQGASKYFPATNRELDAPQMAINIVGSPEVYLVQTTGIQYVHADHEYCILMIEKSGQLPE